MKGNSGIRVHTEPRTGGSMSFTDARRAVVEDRRRVTFGLDPCKGASE
jgi:hypothetical protein